MRWRGSRSAPRSTPRGLTSWRPRCTTTYSPSPRQSASTLAHLPPELEEQALGALGLRAEAAGNQVVQRDRHAHFVSVLAGIGATLEKIAVNLRTLQRTEIGEVQEPFSAGQKGSSAMPH